MIYLEAVKRAGTLDSDKVREPSSSSSRSRPSFGDYKVEADGFQVAHKMVMLQWQDGKKVTVWPDDLAERQARASRRRRGASGSRVRVTPTVSRPRPPDLRRAPGRSA